MIIGVAIKHNNKIHRLPKPYRHIDLIIYLRENTSNKGFDIKGGDSQGFYIDDEDRTFLNRKEAMQYAKEVSNQCPINLINKETLFSEDLW